MLTLLSKLRISRYFTPILFISDLVVLNSAYILSVFMKYGSIEYLWKTDNKSFVLISNMIWIALIIYHKAFKFKRVEPIFKSLNRLFKILIWHTITVICLLIIFKYEAISKLGIVYFFIFFSIGIILYRYAFLKMLKFIRSKGYNFKKVVI